MKESLYDILEVSRTASPEVIRAAYKSLVQRFHPDKNPDDPNAENLLKLINNAYDTLSDPSKRAAYDVMLSLEELASGEPQPEEKTTEESRAPAEPEADRDFAEKWDLYQAFIGRNPNYYRPIFRKFHFSGKTANSFNWTALLAGGGWAAYRKLYGIASLHFVLLAAGLVLVQVLKGPASLLAFLPFLAMSLWISLSANTLYFRQSAKIIGEIAGRETDGAAIFRKVHHAGGVNPLAPFIFACLSVIVALASSELLQPKPRTAVVTVAPPPKPEPLAPKPPASPQTETPPPPEAQEEVLPLPETKPEPKPAPKPKPVPPRHEEIPAKIQRKPEAAPSPPVAMVEPQRRPPAEAREYADLATAVSSGDRAAVEKMIQGGEDVNLVKNNQVPLIIAVKNGDVAMARLLIKRGADVNLTDNQGNTAMIYAKVRADANMIEVLKNAGAKNPFN